jgi:hypothetical protein
MAVWLDRLVNPEYYPEKDIQEAIENLWPCFFGEYRLLSRSQVNMSNNWRPDIVAAYETKGEPRHHLLIIELKGKPAANPQSDAIDQLVGYAKSVHETYPDTPLRLLLIGPWSRDNSIDCIERDGYEVGIMRIESIGMRLTKIAEDYMLWLANNPLQKPEFLGIVEKNLLAMEEQQSSELEVQLAEVA